MKLIIATYLIYLAIRLFFESIRAYIMILKNQNNFGRLKRPLLKFVNGITIISIIYILLQFRWVYGELYTNLDSIDELLWSISEGLMLFTFTNLCSIIRRISMIERT